LIKQAHAAKKKKKKKTGTAVIHKGTFFEETALANAALQLTMQDLSRPKSASE